MNNPAEFTRYRLALIILALLLLILAVYWNVQYFEFIDFDDGTYITENIQIQSGFKSDAILWAFQDIHTGCWHPLTWLSHMLDYNLFRMNAGGHHWTNVLFHAANTIILFVMLFKMTSALWRSAFVAAMFALHPMHVESVTWVSERKDVLSTFFMFLTIVCYLYYLNKRLLSRYAFMLFCYSLSLLSKPMTVTLPFALILLDYWPLKRFTLTKDDRNKMWRLIYEKTPLFFMSFSSIFITFWAAVKTNNLTPLHVLPMSTRIANIFISYAQYIKKAIIPNDMAIFYPYVNDYSWLSVGLSTTLLTGISVISIRFAKQYPFLLIGWLWFLGVLIPVIGLTQNGAQSIADRYTYVSYIGIFIMGAWGLSELFQRFRFRASILSIPAFFMLSILVVQSWKQVQYWENSETIFRHAIEVTEKNYIAETALATYLIKKGNYDAAAKCLQKALLINPGYENIYSAIGSIMVIQQRYDEALTQFHKALALKANNPDLYFNLGGAYYALKRTDEALNSYRKAISLRPDHIEARKNLGIILSKDGKLDAAIGQFQEVLRIKPNDADILNNLGIALSQKGKYIEAEKYFLSAIHNNPRDPVFHVNMGITLSAQGRLSEADSYFRKALHLDPGNGKARHYLRISADQ